MKSKNESPEITVSSCEDQGVTLMANEASLAPLETSPPAAPQLVAAPDISVPGAIWARCRCCVAPFPVGNLSGPSGAHELEPGLSGTFQQVQLTGLIDTHSHAHQELSLEVHSMTQQILPSTARLSGTIVMAVSEVEWPAVLAFTGHSGAVVDGNGNPNASGVSVVDEAHAGATTLVPGLGVHPWYVHENSPGWLSRLRANLVAHPSAVVGEIGLCKCAKNLRGPGNKAKHWPLQLEACSLQLELAAELRRPASVHCVQAHGGLATLFSALLQSSTGTPAREENKHLAEEQTSIRNPRTVEAAASTNTNEATSREESALPLPDIPIWRRLPPAIALHSFSGSVGQLANFLALETAAVHNSSKHKAKKAGGKKSAAQPGTPAPVEAAPPHTTFYFGFSHTINVGAGQVASTALLATIRAVPDDRLLIESDEVGGVLSNEDGALGRCAGAMVRAVQLVADAKGWSCEEAAARTSANAQRFLSAGHVQCACPSSSAT